MSDIEPVASMDLTQAYEEGDPILMNGKPIGTVTKVEHKGGSTFITASLDPEVAKELGGIGDVSLAP